MKFQVGDRVRFEGVVIDIGSENTLGHTVINGKHNICLSIPDEALELVTPVASPSMVDEPPTSRIKQKLEDNIQERMERNTRLNEFVSGLEKCTKENGHEGRRDYGGYVSACNQCLEEAIKRDINSLPAWPPQEPKKMVTLEERLEILERQIKGLQIAVFP